MDSQQVIAKVDSYLKTFQIDRLTIVNADVAISKVEPDTIKEFSITGLSVDIDQFELQTNEQDIGRAFHSANLEIEIIKESITLIPGYTIDFDRFWLSGQDSVVRLEGLKVIPDDPTSDHSVFFPVIQLSGFEILKMLHEKHLQVKRLDFGTGLIETFLKPSRPSGKKPSMPSFLTSVNISEIICNDLDLKLRFTMKETVEELEFDNIDMSIQNLLLSDDYLADPKLLLDQLDFNVFVDKYSGWLSDIEHTFTVDSATIQYKKGLMAVDKISVRPTNPARAKKVFIQSNGFHLEGVNFHDALMTGNLKADQVFLYDPNVRVIVASRNQKKEKSPLDYKNIYPLIRNIFPTFEIGGLRVLGGTVDILNEAGQPIVKAENILLKLNEIRLDSALASNPNQIFGVKHIELHATDLYAHIENNGIELTSSSILLDTKQGLFSSRNLNFFQSSRSRDNIEVKQIQVTGLDWFKALYDKVIIVDNVLIESPHVYIEKIDSLSLPSEKVEISSKPDYPDKILIKNIEFRDGSIEIHKEGQTEVQVTNIKAYIHDLSTVKSDTYVIWNAGYTFYENGPFSINLSDISHRVKGKRLSYSNADSSIRVNQLGIHPYGSEELKFELNIDILKEKIELVKLKNEAFPS